jgi:hypothetical protein
MSAPPPNISMSGPLACWAYACLRLYACHSSQRETRRYYLYMYVQCVYDTVQQLSGTVTTSS